jgi:hypothetical protein
MKFINITLIALTLLSGHIIAQDGAVLFSDSPDGDLLYDSSWGYRNSPSELELAGNNDKFPVDANHPFQGAHSLRLHWLSKSGGDWGIAVAAVGWAAHDVTQYDSLEYYINGPVTIHADDLPDLALEDTGNRKSTRVAMGNWLANVDDDTTTWQRITVPLNAFGSGSENSDFTRIKTLFHFQKNTDDTDHTLWLDEIRFIKAGGTGNGAPAVLQNIIAEGHDSRVDLIWTPGREENLSGYYIYRSDTKEGNYTKLNGVAHTTHVYSDFLGANDQTWFYTITAVNQNFQESVPSEPVQGSSYAMNEEELMSSVQRATFRYFYDYGHPVSGLTRERKGSGNTCTSGGTGFGLMAMTVASNRGFINRDSSAARTLKILRFLQDEAETFHGAWSHWLHGETGKAIPFSANDDGADLVETAYVVQGLLTVRQYFDRDNAEETEIRQRATQMWEAVEWDWFRRHNNSDVLYWHWSPEKEWIMNMPIQGFNETLIVYILAIASPTHGVPASMLHDGWQRMGAGNYENGKSFYDHKIFVGPDYGGPLFFTHYSYLGLDPRRFTDEFCNHFENNRNISLVHRAYCMDNPLSHTGYDSLCWGLTASDNPWGYTAHAPMNNDNGTITPTAALSAFPYVPEYSLPTMKYFYYTLGDRLWGEFGFRDAFNLDQNWFAQSFISIDQGPIILMIENYRTQLLWNLFMADPDIQVMMPTVGVNKTRTRLFMFRLLPNYPNPFNPETTIEYDLERPCRVSLTLYDIQGRLIMDLIHDEYKSAGHYKRVFNASGLASGVYLCRLKSGTSMQTQRMILLR